MRLRFEGLGIFFDPFILADLRASQPKHYKTTKNQLVEFDLFKMKVIAKSPKKVKIEIPASQETDGKQVERKLLSIAYHQTFVSDFSFEYVANGF